MLDFAPPRPSPSSLLLSSSKEGEVLGLTPSNWGHGAAEVPSTFFFFTPGFRFGSSHVDRGLGSVRSISRTKTSLTIWLELHCPGEGKPSLSLDWTSTRTEDSDDFDDLRLRTLARVSFVSLVWRKPALKQGNYLRMSQFRPTDCFVWRDFGSSE